MAERFVVQVDADQFDRLARPTRPLAGAAELIWNALDAEADTITVAIDRTELDAVDAVTVRDDGHGMTHEDALRDFKRLGGSWKKLRPQSKNGKRSLHGKEQTLVPVVGYANRRRMKSRSPDYWDHAVDDALGDLIGDTTAAPLRRRIVGTNGRRAIDAPPTVRALLLGLEFSAQRRLDLSGESVLEGKEKHDQCEGRGRGHDDAPGVADADRQRRLVRA